MNRARVAIAVVGFISVLVFSPWVSVLCIFLLAVRFRSWEAILIGAFMDLTWLSSGTFFHSRPLFTLAALVVVWGFEPLRAQFLVSQ